MKHHTINISYRMLLITTLLFFCSGNTVSGTAMDVIHENDYLSDADIICNVFLEPLQPGNTTSSILGLNCGIKAYLPDFEVNTTYFLASFFDKTNFDSVLIRYYGSSMCSSSISYGVSQVSASVDNRISSGSGYSGCNNIYVYDLANYAGDSASCFANCSSFGALNDRVSSWKVTN